MTFYNANPNDMKNIIDDYLYGISNEEVKRIVEKIKINKYAWLKISLRYPYNDAVVALQVK